jgi:hypothetical protein
VTDLLTHVAVAYALATAVAWHTDRVDAGLVAAFVVGSVVPDVSKLSLLVTREAFHALLGFDVWFVGLHTLGGVLAMAAGGALLVDRDSRWPVFVAIALGGALHLGLDLGVVRADGHAPPYLYPFTWWRPPSFGWYLSSHVWPSLVGVPVALAVLWWDRRRAQASASAR